MDHTLVEPGNGGGSNSAAAQAAYAAAASLAPDDVEQKNIIDKLAQFVAKNGTEFEQMTMQKQANNPKFSFLFGGQYYDYYRAKMTAEAMGASGERLDDEKIDMGLVSDSDTMPPGLHYTGGFSGPDVHFDNNQEGSGGGPPNSGPMSLFGPVGLYTGRFSGPRDDDQPPAGMGFPPGPGFHSGPPSGPFPHGPPPPYSASGSGFGNVPPPASGYTGGFSSGPPPGPVPANAIPPPNPSAGPGAGPTGPLTQPNQSQLEMIKELCSVQSQLAAAQSQLVSHQQQTEQQIKQSESNLAAQYASLPSQQSTQFQESLERLRQDRIRVMARNLQMDMEEIDQVIQPLIESCTKENMSRGKSWILEKMTGSSDSHTLLVNYLLSRVSARHVSFDLRLHVLYLINDLLHHCKRRNLGDLKVALESVVVPIFGLAHALAREQDSGTRVTKLEKISHLWETNNYLGDDILHQLKDPAASLVAWEEELLVEHSNLMNSVQTAVQAQYAQLQQQHTEYKTHLETQVANEQQTISQLQARVQQLTQQQQWMKGQSGGPVPPQTAPQVPPQAPPQVPPQGPQGPPQGPPPGPWGPPGLLPGPFPDLSRPPPGFGPPPMSGQAPVGPQGGPSRDAPGIRGMRPSGPLIPFPPRNSLLGVGPRQQGPPSGHRESRWSSGGPSHPSSKQSHNNVGSSAPSSRSSKPHVDPRPTPNQPGIGGSIVPRAPYHELPAGLMVPLVRLWEFEYRSLDPRELLLPNPDEYQQPSERLIAAVDAFYAPPSHDRPRNAEGWERLGLHEFFKSKERARSAKRKDGGRQRRVEDGGSDGEAVEEPDGRWRRPGGGGGQNYSSRRRSPPQHGSNYSSGSTSLRFRPRSRSATPESSRSDSGRSRSVSRSRSRSRTPSRSRSRSRSRSPPRNDRNRRGRSRSRSGSRSRSRSPPRLSSAPLPSYQGGPPRLGSENRGHQMLQRMGWSGQGGLGARGQGRMDPVDAGAAPRDRYDQYAGVGVAADPFEQFRKRKSQGFTAMMKAKADATTGDQDGKDQGGESKGGGREEEGGSGGGRPPQQSRMQRR